LKPLPRFPFWQLIDEVPSRLEIVQKLKLLTG
jgi:hypothetical protein